MRPIQLKKAFQLPFRWAAQSAPRYIMCLIRANQCAMVPALTYVETCAVIH